MDESTTSKPNTVSASGRSPIHSLGGSQFNWRAPARVRSGLRGTAKYCPFLRLLATGPLDRAACWSESHTRVFHWQSVCMRIYRAGQADYLKSGVGERIVISPNNHVILNCSPRWSVSCSFPAVVKFLAYAPLFQYILRLSRPANTPIGIWIITRASRRWRSLVHGRWL